MSVWVRHAEGAGTIVPPRISKPHIAGDLMAVVVGAAVAIAIGAAVAVNPLLALLPVAALAGILLLVDARARILFLVFGGFLALQSSQGVGSVKLLYLAGVLVSLGGALFRFSKGEDRLARGVARPLMRVSIAMSTLIAISLLVAQAHGISTTNSLRDLAPYVLFACAPVFAIDAAGAFSHRGLVRLLVIAGIAATLSFATNWLEIRGNRSPADLEVRTVELRSSRGTLRICDRVCAPHESSQDPLGLVIGACVRSHARHRDARMTLILAIAPIVVVIGARRLMSGRFIRLALGGPIAVAADAGGSPTASSLPPTPRPR